MRYLVGVLLILSFSTGVQAMKPNEYYEHLRQTRCPKAANESCCRASVTEMQKKHLRPIEGDKQCPEGFVKRSIRCPSSLNWCEYRPDWSDTPVFAPGDRK